jgi:hypothetical protein
MDETGELLPCKGSIDVPSPEPSSLLTGMSLPPWHNLTRLHQGARWLPLPREPWLVSLDEQELRTSGLSDLGAAALNQEQQHNHGQHAAYDPNHGYIVHGISPFKLVSKKL